MRPGAESTAQERAASRERRGFDLFEERYRVEIKLSAIRELEGIARKGDRQRLARRIGALGTQPRPPGFQKLVGDQERYRVRPGRYRVIYAIDDAERLVTVFRIGDRKDVYR